MGPGQQTPDGGVPLNNNAGLPATTANLQPMTPELLQQLQNLVYTCCMTNNSIKDLYTGAMEQLQVLVD